METLWRQVRNTFLDYFLIRAGGSSDCAVALQSTSSQRQGEAASSDQHPRLAAKPKTTMKTGAWRMALCTWLEGISKLLRKPPASSHGNENCVHAMWPRVPSQVLVHVTWNQTSKWRHSLTTAKTDRLRWVDKDDVAYRHTVTYYYSAL